jgi:hypothetical protein
MMNGPPAFEDFVSDLTTSPSDSLRGNRIQSELFTVKQLLISRIKPSLPKLRDAMYKLAYMAMVGVDIDFGLPEIQILLTSDKYSFVRAGWFVLICFGITDEIALRPIIPILLRQLCDFQNEPIQCCALTAAVEIFSVPLMQVIGPEIAKIAVSPKSSETIRKRALHAAAAIYRNTKEPYVLSVLSPALPVFMDSPSYALRNAAAVFACTVMGMHPGALVGICDISLSQLHFLFVRGIGEIAVIAELYYATPSPWYARMLIKILGFKTNWTPDDLAMIDGVALALFGRVGETLSIRPAMAYFIVFSELLNLFARIPVSADTVHRCAWTLARYLEVDPPYVTYFALNSLNRLLSTNPNVVESVDNARPALYHFLHHPDIGTIRFSVNLLYLIGRARPPGPEIVGELMTILPIAPLEIRPLLCTRTAALALSLSQPKLYLDCVIGILREAGDYCDDSIWHTAIRVLADNPALQSYVTKSSIAYLKGRVCPPDQLMKFTVSAIGDAEPDDIRIVLKFIFARFTMHRSDVQAMMLTAVMRIATRAVAILPTCCEFLRIHCSSPDLNVSERASQYLALVEDLPANAPQLMSRMPNGFDSHAMIKQIMDRANHCEGVSEFEFRFDPGVDAFPSDVEMIDAFLFSNAGFLYHDLFVNVYAEIDFQPPLIDAQFRFDNNGIFPLVEMEAVLGQTPGIVTTYEPIENIIPVSGNCVFHVVFELITIANEFPKIEVKFKCANTERTAIVVVPIHFVRCIESIPLPPAQLREKWLSITQPELQCSLVGFLSEEAPDLDLAFRQSLGLSLMMARPQQFATVGYYRCRDGPILILSCAYLSGDHKRASVMFKASTSEALAVVVSRFTADSGLTNVCMTNK